MSTFTELGLSAALEARLAAQGITSPSPVQEQGIPVLLTGKNALLEAPTGTGKTLAYLLPALARLAAPSERPQQAEASRSASAPKGAAPRVLVLVPTPELALQVREVARGLLEGPAASVQALLGGANAARQAETLKKGPAVVVGTPGRVLDFIRQGRLSGRAVEVLVVDEVDLLLDQGNRADLEAIAKALSPSRQSIFASATLGTEAEEWARRYLKEPEKVSVRAELKLPPTIEHVAFVVDQRDKLPFIRRLVRHYDPVGAIAFVNRTEAIPEMVSKLQYHKVRVAGLHGGARKLDRAAVMRDFRAGKLQLLVASDLAARGLDLSGVSVVFNLDLPTDAEHYVHRVGRTGRMGREGLAVTVVDPREAFVLDKLEKSLGFTFERPVYTEGEVRERTDIDEKREVRKARAKARAAAPDKPAGTEDAKPKKLKKKPPTARALAKGKARKAKRQASKRPPRPRTAEGPAQEGLSPRRRPLRSLRRGLSHSEG